MYKRASLLIAIWCIVYFSLSLWPNPRYPTQENQIKLHPPKSWNQGQLTLVYPTVKRDCSKLIAGDEEEMIKVRNATRDWNVTYQRHTEVTINCTQLRDMFNNTLYISKLRLSFPIAFIFVVYESPEQFLRCVLVHRFTYAPQFSQHCLSYVLQYQDKNN